MQFYEEAFLLSAHILSGCARPSFIVFFFFFFRGETIIMQWFVVFHFQQFQTEHCPSQDYFQAHNGNKPACFIVQFNPQPFRESMCILCPSNKFACWMNNHLSLPDNVFLSNKCSQLWEPILKTNAGEAVPQYLQNSRSYDIEACVWWKKRLTRDCLSRKKKHPRGGHFSRANVSMWNAGRSSVCCLTAKLEQKCFRLAEVKCGFICATWRQESVMAEKLFFFFFLSGRDPAAKSFAPSSLCVLLE